MYTDRAGSGVSLQCEAVQETLLTKQETSCLVHPTYDRLSYECMFIGPISVIVLVMELFLRTLPVAGALLLQEQFAQSLEPLQPWRSSRYGIQRAIAMLGLTANCW